MIVPANFNDRLRAAWRRGMVTGVVIGVTTSFVLTHLWNAVF